MLRLMVDLCSPSVSATSMARTPPGRLDERSEIVTRTVYDATSRSGCTSAAMAVDATRERRKNRVSSRSRSWRLLRSAVLTALACRVDAGSARARVNSPRTASSKRTNRTSWTPGPWSQS